jgi:CheY-like chemotaxis protein
MTKRILIVEDQDLRGVLRDLLAGSGYAVAEAANGREGVAMAKAATPDLILIHPAPGGRRLRGHAPDPGRC